MRLPVAWGTIWYSGVILFLVCTDSICMAHYTCSLYMLITQAFIARLYSSFPATGIFPSAVDHDTTIRMQTLPGYHTAVLTRQENEAGRNLRRLRGTAHRRPTELILCRLVHGRRDEGSPDRPWADSVDTDPFTDLLVVEAAGEGDDGAFGGGVVE